MKKVNIKVLVTAALVVIVALIVLLNSSLFNFHSASKIPEYIHIENKVVGSRLDPSLDIVPWLSLKQMTSYADLIIVGKITSEAVTETMPGYRVANVKVEIEKVIYGEIDESEIMYIQTGYQTKVKSGERVLLILKTNNGEVWGSVSAEEGVFVIDQHNRVTSLSDTDIVAKYDGSDLSNLIKAIEKSLD